MSGGNMDECTLIPLKNNIFIIHKSIHVGFEALTEVLMRSSIFWDITQCRM
jgi:hypothetical protein